MTGVAIKNRKVDQACQLRLRAALSAKDMAKAKHWSPRSLSALTLALILQPRYYEYHTSWRTFRSGQDPRLSQRKREHRRVPNVVYQLAVGGTGPKAIINLNTETIIAVGAIMGGIPVVDHLEKDPFPIIETGDYVKVDAVKGVVEVIKKGER
jgi:hypothetical protein